MNDITAAKEARSILVRSTSPVLRALGETLSAYLQQRTVPHGQESFTQLLDSGLRREAVLWCVEHNTTLDQMQSKRRYPPQLVLHKHMIRKHLCALGYRCTDIARLFDIDHASVIYSRDLPNEKLYKN